MWASDLDMTSSRRMLEHDTANAICANAYNYETSVASHRKEYYERLRAVLADYYDATLHRLSIPLSPLTHGFALLELICYDNLSEESINDWYMMVESNTIRNAVARYAAGLTTYKNLVPQNEGNYPSERLAQVAAIVRVTECLYAQGRIAATDDTRGNLKLMVHIGEEALRDYLDTSADPASLAEIIISRDYTTAREVAEFLAASDQVTAPLKVGVL